eukprot:1195551-Prorocentrum_minimum.AAC.3
MLSGVSVVVNTLQKVLSSSSTSTGADGVDGDSSLDPMVADPSSLALHPRVADEDSARSDTPAVICLTRAANCSTRRWISEGDESTTRSGNALISRWNNCVGDVSLSWPSDPGFLVNPVAAHRPRAAKCAHLRR